MFGKVFSFFVASVVVYAPPVPSTTHENEVHSYLSKTPTSLHEACIMIGELRHDLNQQSKALKKAYAAMVPMVLKDYIESFEVKFTEESSTISSEDMLKALNMTEGQVDTEMHEIFKRADFDEDQKLKDAMMMKAATRFIRWKYFLVFSQNSYVKTLKLKLEAFDINEENFPSEIAFLYAKTWSSVHSYAPSLELDTILEGLHLYRLAYPNTVNAVKALYHSQIRALSMSQTNSNFKFS